MNLITQDYFYKTVDIEKGFDSIYYPDLICDGSKYPFIENFFEIPGKGLFVLIPIFKRLLIPKEFPDLTLEIIKSYIDLDLEDWVIDKISDEPDKKYIINHYCKHYSFLNPSEKIKGLEEGSFMLKNLRTGENIDYSVKCIDKYYYSKKTPYICFPEKAEDLIHIKDINRKENFILFIINGKDRKDGEADPGSDQPC